MRMMQKKQVLLVSLLGHAILVACMGIRLSFFQQDIPLGEKPSDILASYMYQESLLNPPLPPSKVVTKPSIDKIASLKLTKPMETVLQKSSSPTTQQTKQPPSPEHRMSGNGKPLPALLSLLHAAIQKQQQYPASALQMEREGKTTLIFLLFPDGHIQHLSIIQSSGTAALDEAALAAVNRAAPFKGVDKHLSAPQTYQITVSFELT
jgi:periplasmic protein TonB